MRSMRLVQDGSCGPGSALGSSGILCCSLTQAPRSISRQRSLQKGRYGDFSDHSTGRRQVGHFTWIAIAAAQVQQVS
jgi:hypothetical protein